MTTVAEAHGEVAPSLLSRLLSWRWSYGLSGKVGLALFGLFCLTVGILVALHPDARSVAIVYRAGALGWWRGEDIFGSGPHGFIYLPSFAVLYSPFAFMGAGLGDIAWRAVSVGVLVAGLWQALGVVAPGDSRRARLIDLGVIFLLMLLGGSGAIRNGQATIIMFGLTLLSAVELSKRQWWRAAVMLALAFAIKPLAIVFILLAGALYPKTAPRLALTVAAALLLPLVNIHPDIAWRQYALGIQKLMVAGAPGDGRWSDITGPLHKIGLFPVEGLLTAVRVVAAAGTLALGWLALRTNPDRARAALTVFGLSVVYLILFCPRTESESFTMLAALLGLHVAMLWKDPAQRGLAWFLAALAVLLGNGAFGSALMHATDLWFKPLICLAFAPLMIRSCWPANDGRFVLFPRAIPEAAHG